MSNWCFTRPPTPDPNSQKSFDKLQPITIDELKSLRSKPKYSPIYFVIQIFCFTIFGIPKVLLAGSYALIAGVIYMASCAFWRALGCPESWRRPLQLLWSAFARVLLFLLGIVHINFKKRPDSDARFLISNHLCFFDSWLFLPLLPRPLDKKELLDIPCIQDMFQVFDGITVDRTKSNGMTRVLIENASDPNRPMIQIFPEGATTNGDYMLRFHVGAFLSDLPLQPTIIRYKCWFSSPNWTHVSFFHNHPKQWLSFLAIPFITVDMTFLEVVSLKCSEEGDPREFADEVSLMMGKELGIPVVDMTSSAIYKQRASIKTKKD